MNAEDELAEFNRGFSKPLADQDGATVSSYCTDDTRLLLSGVPIIRGRDEQADGTLKIAVDAASGDSAVSSSPV